jgi:hypothetical protein
MGFNRVDRLSGTEMEFIVECRKLVRLCYKLNNHNPNRVFLRLIKQLMNNCDDILIEGIGPLYTKSKRWTMNWSEYTQMYIINVWNITVLMFGLELIEEDKRDQIIEICDKLLYQIQLIKGDNPQSVGSCDLDD